MDKYESNLHHVARPADPNDRNNATSITLLDYEALYFKTKLREHAEYETDGTEADIARAYVEYINEQVRDMGSNALRVYAHTETAIDVLQSALPDSEERVFRHEKVGGL